MNTKSINTVVRGQNIELMPGGIASGVAGTSFSTLLGSCVSVVLTDPGRTVGTMCHIVHVGSARFDDQDNPAYGEVAMRMMFDAMMSYGMNPRACQAFIYGGGNMFPEQYGSGTVGERNVAWVEDFLDSQGLRIHDKSVGGPCYRKVNWVVGPENPTLELSTINRN
jgi:chemotaxis protein CheD